MGISRKVSGWPEALVKAWAEHKTAVLGVALVLTAIFAVISLLMVFGEHEGGHLTHLAADIGGFVAIVGLLIGVPALGYAMVTDHTVAQLRHDLGLSVGSLDEKIQATIDDFDWKLRRRHYIQVFMPIPGMTMLGPVYNRRSFGAKEEWSIDPNAPQGITGSAWVKNEYLLGLGEDLKHPRLRLSDEQLNRIRDPTGVAAQPIHDPDKGDSKAARIGVLTIVTVARRRSMLEEPGFEEHHEKLAEALAPVLVSNVPKPGPLDQDTDLKKGQAVLKGDQAAIAES